MLSVREFAWRGNNSDTTHTVVACFHVSNHVGLTRAGASFFSRDRHPSACGISTIDEVNALVRVHKVLLLYVLVPLQHIRSYSSSTGTNERRQNSNQSTSTIRPCLLRYTKTVENLRGGRNNERWRLSRSIDQCRRTVFLELH